MDNDPKMGVKMDSHNKTRGTLTYFLIEECEFLPYLFFFFLRTEDAGIFSIMALYAFFNVLGK